MWWWLDVIAQLVNNATVTSRYLDGWKKSPLYYCSE